MVIGIIGESCAGKSTLANRLQAELGGTVVTGRDYLRLAKSEAEATTRFQRQLQDAVIGENLIFVISDPAQLALLPEGAVRILVTADLDTLLERFRRRMGSKLPEPVAQMLRRKHGQFDGGAYDYRYDGAAGDPAQICAALAARTETSIERPDPERSDA